MVYASSLSFTVRPDHVRVAAEFGPPEPVAQDDHVLAAWRVLLLPKDPSKRRPSSDGFEKARTDECRRYCSRGASPSERDLPEAATLIHGHALERPRIPLPVVELAWGELEESTARCPGEDPHKPFGLLERQRTQQDRVHDAENRSVGADAQRQHADDRNGERGRPEHHPERIVKIGKQRTHGQIPPTGLDEAGGSRVY